MRTLLLTGRTGFVGRTVLRAVTEWSFEDDWQVATLPDHFDIQSEALAMGIRPDAVLHLAARTSVAESFLGAERYFAVNFHGTWNPPAIATSRESSSPTRVSRSDPTL